MNEHDHEHEHIATEPGLPRLVLEARARLGPTATPEEVADDLQAHGIDGVSIEDIRAVWDEGHLPG